MNEFGKRLDGPGGRRSQPRDPIVLTAALLSVRCSRSIILVDVSRTGAQIHVREAMEPGQEIWIKAHAAQMFGVIKWVEGEACGVAFDEPLDADQLAMLQAEGKVTMQRRCSPEEQVALEDWDHGTVR
ncbi:MAG TPA: PilZ domain-containing protein [Sphingomicrobium sp.]|nr:PilZ domain-containing protein [Sphingomicrobium sp.]